MKLCTKPTYIALAYTSGTLSNFGRDDPEWRGTPPFVVPNPDARKTTVTPEGLVYPPPDEATLLDYLEQKKVSKKDTEPVKAHKRLGAKARKEYRPTQKVAVRRKNALREQALNLRQATPVLLPSGDPLVIKGIPQTQTNEDKLIKAIQTWANPSARQVQNAVNTVDRYERWMRGQLSPAELEAINAGKLNLPTRSQKEEALAFLTRTENTPLGGLGVSNPPIVPEQPNRGLARRLEGTANVLTELFENARPVREVFSDRDPITGERLPEGSLSTSIKKAVAERNKREAERLASGELYDRDVAVQRGINPEISVAPSYIAPEVRDPTNPVGIKPRTPVRVQYTPTGTQTGLKNRREKIRRVLRLLEESDANKVYGKGNLLQKAGQDVQLLQSQLKPDVLKELILTGSQGLSTLKDTAQQRLNQFINAPNRLPPMTGSSRPGRRLASISSRPELTTDYTTPSMTGRIPLTVSASKSTKSKQDKKDKNLIINISLPDTKSTEVKPTTKSAAKTSAVIPNINAVDTIAPKTEQIAETASRGNLIQRIRDIGSQGDNKFLRAGAALAGAGGVLLAGNMLANSLIKDDSGRSDRVSVPSSIYSNYPSYPYSYPYV